MEREPRPQIIKAYVMTCKGEVFTHVLAGSGEGLIRKAQVDIVVEHDQKWHQRSNPCHKSFYTRP